MTAYDAVIDRDAKSGVVPVAKLSQAVNVGGTNKVPFNFGSSSRDVTMEFIVEGNATGGTASVLAMGTNSLAALYYKFAELPAQMGFSISSIAEYRFTQTVTTPSKPTHVVYAWDASIGTMKLYLDGKLVGTKSGVLSNFEMPRGLGWLGRNRTGGAAMSGIIHRVTVYDDLLPEELLVKHANAYKDVFTPPAIYSFQATPDALIPPTASKLTWIVEGASSVSINGQDVTSLSEWEVTPLATTSFTLIATSPGGSTTGVVSVVVNPAPSITRFAATPSYGKAGENLNLSWESRFGQSYFISPGIGNVTPQTLDGSGNIQLPFSATLAYVLTVRSPFGETSASLPVTLTKPAATPVISEFMANNQNGIEDEEGQKQDWIELYNPTDKTVNLAGYYLTDDRSDPTKWALPALDLAARTHLIVFASEKNRTNPVAPLHANFRLESNGEYLALVDSSLRIIQAFNPYPSQRADVSYGCLGGDVSVVRSMGNPTPGGVNDAAPPPPEPVEFSQNSSFFSIPFVLALSHSPPNVIIHYTTDGSTPDATHGITYSAPLTIERSTRVRAIAVGKEGESKISAARYIKLSAELTNYTSTLPILVVDNFGGGIIPEKNIGNCCSGLNLRQPPWQDAVWATFERQGTLSSFTNPPQMFSRVGVRGRGSASSGWPQKAYGVEARTEDDEELEVSPLGMPKHSDWVLSWPYPNPSGVNDSSLLFNTFAFELYQGFGREYGVRFRWVEAFINEDGGELKMSNRRGVYAIVEKVSRGKDRLSFEPLSEDGSRGGWIIGLNRLDAEPATGWPAPNGAKTAWFFHTAGRNRKLETPNNVFPARGDDEPQYESAQLNFDNPNGYTINLQQRTAIEKWFSDFEDVLWNDAVWRDPTHGYRKFIHAEDFADYFLINTLTRHGDALLVSMYLWKGDDGKLRMGPTWDNNYLGYYASGTDPAGDLLYRSNNLWYRRLFADPDFYQLFIDRWWDHRRGPMSNQAMDDIINRQADDISAPKAILNGFANANAWAGNITQMKNWLKGRANWIDSRFVRPPFFNREGGAIPDGFELNIIGTNGVIYFTIDGSDPRASGGSIAAAAQTFQQPFNLYSPTTISARILNGTNWSGLTQAQFEPPQNLSQLAITEIMYNPTRTEGYTANDLEFLELQNTGATLVDLSALTFTGGISFTFTNGTRLLPGQFFVLTRNAAAFQSRYSQLPQGVYSGQLDNSGETIRLSTPTGLTLLSVTYDRSAPWPIAPNGQGFSLVTRGGASIHSSRGADWRASSTPGGSPGFEDPEPSTPPILISEISARSGDSKDDWIELFNPTGQPVSIGGWYLSDDSAFPKKFKIPASTSIPAHGFATFTEKDFNPNPNEVQSFSLNASGDSVYLSSGDGSTHLTGYSHGFNFGASGLGISFGRYVNSVGEEQFPALEIPTLGESNVFPRVGPVVMTEIQYHPAPGEDAFIELQNITLQDVPLFHLDHPTLTWRCEGLGFQFPTNIILKGQSRLLIVSGSPDGFRSRYAVGPEVQILGPFVGALKNGGERLQLQRPDVTTGTEVLYITMDEVRYQDRAPWPAAADGSGASLQRFDPQSYANDPGFWEAARPTPGTLFAPSFPPQFVKHPESIEVVSGQSAQFVSQATGEPLLHYQWAFNGTPLFGATNAILVLQNIRPDQAGEYYSVVYNEMSSAESLHAQLTVNRAPTILSPPTNSFVRVGSNITFAVTAVGNGPLHYQWSFNGLLIPNATNTSLILPNVQPAQRGLYTVAITDKVGTTYSSPALLEFLISTTIVQGPASQSVAPGQIFTLSATAAGSPTPIGFEWRRGNSIIASNTVNGLTDFIQLTAPATPGNQSYRVIVRNLANQGLQANAVCNISTLSDSDSDGIPDEWETLVGLDPNNKLDANLDTDGDRLSNKDEFIAGTDPNQGSDVLTLDASLTQGGTLLSFQAISNRTYSILVAEDLQSQAWTDLLAITALPTNRTERFLDTTRGTNRFYRIQTPVQR